MGGTPTEADQAEQRHRLANEVQRHELALYDLRQEIARVRDDLRSLRAEVRLREQVPPGRRHLN